ncbi:hypothetical protein B0H65DRAFT_184077 [Neurospora tetraspora]|uniref:Uncharacterized protein n=1 Tax=Neurospora tetraspora TaxID=94610 RepID=A0AAE0JE97_9PEZI|nr:hypothetical protein B0H65DRAFT_184077 [Neurospora tetraspora]
MANQGIDESETELLTISFGDLLQYYIDNPPFQPSVEASRTDEGRLKRRRARMLQEQLKPTADRGWPKAFYLFYKRSINDQESPADQLKRIQAFFTRMRPGPTIFGYGITYRDLIHSWGVEIEWDSEPDIKPLDIITEIKPMFKEMLADHVHQVDFTIAYQELPPQ